MNQLTTEQIRTVAVYDGWKLRIRDHVCQYLSIFEKGKDLILLRDFTYHTDLNKIAPVYPKVMGELRYIIRHCGSETPDHKNARYYMDALRSSATTMQVSEVFQQVFEAIRFLNAQIVKPNEQSKDNNPA